MRLFAPVFLLFFSLNTLGQVRPAASDSIAGKWADSVMNTLNNDERIAQLMVVRLSSIDLKTRQISFYDQKVADLVSRYNIGGVCLFQGSPVKQANMINALQKTARTPLLICMDAEWGVGMRITDSVLPLPKQMMLGAIKDKSVIYKYGRVVATQCRRMGIQVNYAPVVDVNNNPGNPVINDRSFGEDKYKVADYGIQYMKGMQDMGVMACAKHFPGHGDVTVDSHVDLPVINKSLAELDSLELYPFRKIFDAGVSSAMIAHLYIPAIDSQANRASSISKANVTGLLRDQLHYDGLTFTDALEMQGVKKFFPNGEASAESIIAGNDMLCLPDSVPLSIERIKDAIAVGKLSWEDINMHCRKVLMAKYQYGLSKLQPININNLTADLNNEVPAMTRTIAENAITLLAKKDDRFFPLDINSRDTGKIAYVAVGVNTDNAFATGMRNKYKASVFYFDYTKKDSLAILKTIDSITNEFSKVVIGIHNMGRSPVTNFGLSRQAIDFTRQLQAKTSCITFLFGNAYAIKNFCDAPNLVLCYEDNEVIQQTALEMLQGELPYKGVLPVTVCDQYTYGSGISAKAGDLPYHYHNQFGFDAFMSKRIDSIANDAIAKKAIPGCVVLVAKNGKIAFQKAYGNYAVEKNDPVLTGSVFDMASVTKICATTLCVMKLVDEGKLDIKKKLGDYLPELKGSNKEKLAIEKVLLHQAGLPAYIPFYKETIDSSGTPLPAFYRQAQSDSFPIRVANELYLRKDWKDSIYKRVINCPLGPADKYVYSDNDFIFLGKLVETISGKSLDEFAQKKFYTPMSLESAAFFPARHVASNRIVPTENEKDFRKQLIKGDVHDPGAAMFGGVAGHAGLFSDAYDIACIMQMLLNGGSFNGRRYLQKETIDLFTAYHSSISRRGYGFDKPEKDNATRPEPYPCLSASAKTFGHTGFTGTCAWADPDKNLVFVFLSNRVNAADNSLFLKMNIRPKIHETIYQSLAGQ